MIKNPSCMVKIQSCYAVAHEYHNNTTHRVINLLKLVVTGEWRLSAKRDSGGKGSVSISVINRQRANICEVPDAPGVKRFTEF
jgi:hypothetical protein